MPNQINIILLNKSNRTNFRLILIFPLGLLCTLAMFQQCFLYLSILTHTFNVFNALTLTLMFSAAKLLGYNYAIIVIIANTSYITWCSLLASYIRCVLLQKWFSCIYIINRWICSITSMYIADNLLCIHAYTHNMYIYQAFT